MGLGYRVQGIKCMVLFRVWGLEWGAGRWPPGECLGGAFAMVSPGYKLGYKAHMDTWILVVVVLHGAVLWLCVI